MTHALRSMLRRRPGSVQTTPAHLGVALLLSCALLLCWSMPANAQGAPPLVLELVGVYPGSVSESASSNTRNPANSAREVEAQRELQHDVVQFNVRGSSEAQVFVNNFTIARTDSGTSPEQADVADFKESSRFTGSGGSLSDILVPSVTFPISATAQNIYELAIVNDDNLIELTETMAFRASYEYLNAENVWVAATSAVVTFSVTNADHGDVSVETAVLEVDEGDNAQVVFALSKRASFPVRFEWEVVSGETTAIADADYTLAGSGSVTIAAGALEATLDFPIIDDGDEDDEIDESLVIAITSVTRADGTTPTYATGIADDADSTSPAVVVGTDDKTTITIPAASTDATLSGLMLADNNDAAVTLNPATFVPASLDYTADVANGVPSVMVTPIVNDGGASVTVASADVTSGDASEAIDLNVGDNAIPIVVAAEDTRVTETYTIRVTRADNTAPTISGATTDLSFDENATGTVATYIASDTENNAVAWSLGGDDADAFMIDATSGVLTFNDPPDFETQATYEITVIATETNGVPNHLASPPFSGYD